MGHSVNAMQLPLIAPIIPEQIVYIVDNNESGRTNAAMFAAVVIYLFLVDSMDELVELFELLIPDEQKKEKGVAYTPREVKQFIVKEVLSDCKPQTVLDPACGCGAFLVTATEYMHEKYALPLLVFFLYRSPAYQEDIDCYFAISKNCSTPLFHNSFTHSAPAITYPPASR